MIDLERHYSDELTTRSKRVEVATNLALSDYRKETVVSAFEEALKFARYCEKVAIMVASMDEQRKSILRAIRAEIRDIEEMTLLYKRKHPAVFGMSKAMFEKTIIGMADNLSVAMGGEPAKR